MKYIYNESGAVIESREEQIKSEGNFVPSKPKGIEALYDHLPSHSLTTFLHNKSAENASLVMRTQSLSSNLPAKLITLIRVRKWLGKNTTTQTHYKCECGTQLSFEHLMICKSLQTMREYATQRVFETLKKEHTSTTDFNTTLIPFTLLMKHMINLSISTQGNSILATT